jgi:carbonic anhydrase
MQRIIDGIRQFRREQFPALKEDFVRLAKKKQNPLAMLITCSDSRVNPNLITHTDPGDLFLHRNAGNIVPPYGHGASGEAATIEYAVEVLGIRNIIVCGHSHCGAMQALLQEHLLDDLPAATDWFAHAHSTRKIVRARYPGMAVEELVAKAAHENVLVQLANLRTHPVVAAGIAMGTLEVFGWYYEIESGLIYAYDPELKRFTAIGDHEDLSSSRASFQTVGGRS